MTRRFVYNTSPDEVRRYITGLGFEVREDYSRDGTEAIGFTVLDTTVRLSYDIVVDGSRVGRGMIGLSHSLLVRDPNNPYNSLIDDDPKRYQRSLKLYRRLYRRFRERGSD